MGLKDRELILHSCRAHPDLPTLEKNVAVLYEQRRSQGSASLLVNLQMYTAVFKQNQRGDCSGSPLL